MEGDDDDKLDEEDLAVLKEENKNEHELQISLAEIFGILFKTHKQHCKELVQKLLSQVLPEVAKQTSKHYQKFVLFILDDMIEFLGPDHLGPVYPQIVAQVCQYSASKFSAIRQASVYGVGMVAQHGGAAFQAQSGLCLDSLKTAISFQMDAATQEKKSKQTQFNHARDNAIAALGKIIKYQEANIDAAAIIPSWVSLLPLHHDLEEAQMQNEIFAEILITRPAMVLGANNEGLEQLAVILGTICTKK